MSWRDRFEICEDRIVCNLTGEDWDLYTFNMNCSPAVKALNKGVEKHSNTRLKSAFEKNMLKVMDKYSKFGATDSEPIWMLRAISDAIYGDEQEGWI